MKVIFIRTAPYIYHQPNKTLYESLDAIGLQIIQPHILKASEEIQEKVDKILDTYNVSRVLCSELLRSYETAKLFSKHTKAISELNEIKFSMNDFAQPSDLPGESLERKKIDKIRFNFSLALMNDSLRERQEFLSQRMNSLKKTLITKDKNEIVLCCSHGFIMKLYENFYKNRCETNNVKELVSMYDWNKTPFDFLDGFVVSFTDREYRVSELDQF